MTLKLYSFGPGANSLKPLATLYEKALPFEPVFVDPAKFEQHSDWFKAINPRGQVPALWHDGKIITEDLAIETLRRIKDDVKEVKAGFECGIKLAGYDDIKQGDRLEAYIRETIQRTL